MRQQDVMSNIRCYQIIAHNSISDIKFRTQNKAEERRSQRIDIDFGLIKIYNETISLEVLQHKFYWTTSYDSCKSDTTKERKYKILRQY